MNTHVFRLHPGQDLRTEIDRYVAEHHVRAGAIVTCVGNLTKAVLRMADAKVIRTWEGSYEIVSLVGTVEVGNSHLHIAVSDDQGVVYGGHLKEGSIVGVTAEIVIMEIENTQFTRSHDPTTGYEELVVKTTRK